jgi:4-amino-4-deoxy-L-arabinose transferase-like glycosyltransferase
VQYHVPHRSSTMRSVRRRVPLALAIFLVVGGTYLLGTGREQPWGDAKIVYEVVEAMEDGRLSIKTEWPPMSHLGADGQIYSQYALLPSIAHAPGRVLFGVLGSHRAPLLNKIVTSHIAPAFAAALTCAMFFLAAFRLSRDRRAALAATGVVAFASLLVVYARYPLTESLQAACVMGLVHELLAIADGDHRRRRGIALGLWAGALLNAKAVLVLGAIGGIAVTAILVRDRAALRRLAIGGLIGGAPWLAMFLAYNHLRWGSPLDTGYGETLGMMKESLPAGLLGLLASPGKGLLWFSPCVILAVVAMARTWSAHRKAFIVVLAVVLPPLVFYAKFLSWAGDYAWGPRYLVYAVAPLLLALAPWFAITAGRLRRWFVRVVIALSVGVQLLGSLIFSDHWILLAREARLEWLGNPNRKGALIAEAGRGHCDSCFEDMYGHQWLPPFAPIRGHLWLVRHKFLAGDTWAEAQAEAPWRSYTNLELKRPTSAQFYADVHVDWWGLEVDAKNWHIAVVFAGLALVMIGGGAWILRRRLSEPPDP